MEELKGSSEVVSSIFTSNIGVLSHVLSYYNYAHMSAYLMQTLWTGSRRLFFKNDFEFILKETRKCIKFKIEDTENFKFIEKANMYFTFEIFISKYFNDLAHHICNLTDMQLSYNLVIKKINKNNFSSMLKVISSIMVWGVYNIKILNISNQSLHKDFMPYIQNIYFSKSLATSVKLNDEFIESLQHNHSNTETELNEERIKIPLEDIASHPAVLK